VGGVLLLLASGGAPPVFNQRPAGFHRRASFRIDPSISSVISTDRTQPHPAYGRCRVLAQMSSYPAYPSSFKTLLSIKLSDLVTGNLACEKPSRLNSDKICKCLGLNFSTVITDRPRECSGTIVGLIFIGSDSARSPSFGHLNFGKWNSNPSEHG
jgi:hypothetical protein